MSGWEWVDPKMPLSFYFSFKSNAKERHVGNYKLKLESCPKMAENYDGETPFSPTNSAKEYLNAEPIPQNNF